MTECAEVCIGVQTCAHTGTIAASIVYGWPGPIDQPVELDRVDVAVVGVGRLVGDRAHHAELAYLTGFTPKLESALALIPLVILWFGIDETAKLFLVALGVFFPIYLNTFHGIRAVDPALIEMARSYGLSGFALYRQVILPGALPSIFTGLRLSLQGCLTALVAAELLGALLGMGKACNTCKKCQRGQHGPCVVHHGVSSFVS